MNKELKNTENELIATIVDPQTGEIINNLYSGDRIYRGNSWKFMNETTEIGRGEKFIKIFKSALNILGNESLTGNDWKILTTMLSYLRDESGLIAHINGKPLLAKDISELSEIGESSTFRAIEKLIRKKIIAKNRIGFNEIKFYINPFIFTKNRRINKTLYTMFKSSKWQKLHDNCDESYRNSLI